MRLRSQPRKRTGRRGKRNSPAEPLSALAEHFSTRVVTGPSARTRSTEVARESKFRSSLLSEELRAFAEAPPGLSRTLMQLSIAEMKHRRQIERDLVGARIKTLVHGQRLGFAVALIGLGVAGLLGVRGHALAATIISTVQVVSLVRLFLGEKRPGAALPNS